MKNRLFYFFLGALVMFVGYSFGTLNAPLNANNSVTTFEDVIIKGKLSVEDEIFVGQDMKRYARFNAEGLTVNEVTYSQTTRSAIYAGSMFLQRGFYKDRLLIPDTEVILSTAGDSNDHYSFLDMAGKDSDIFISSETEVICQCR